MIPFLLWLLALGVVVLAVWLSQTIREWRRMRGSWPARKASALKTVNTPARKG